LVTGPTETPSVASTKFKNKIEHAGYECYILNKREIEYYYPESVHVEAQQSDLSNETATKAILNGDQGIKYRSAAAQAGGLCVPKGTYLKKLLLKNLTNKDQLDVEIRSIIENKLIVWKKEILGEQA
jgi:hypothetical protein